MLRSYIIHHHQFSIITKSIPYSHFTPTVLVHQFPPAEPYTIHKQKRFTVIRTLLNTLYIAHLWLLTFVVYDYEYSHTSSTQLYITLKTPLTKGRIRSLIDTGADISLISANTLLNLPPANNSITIKGICMYFQWRR